MTELGLTSIILIIIIGIIEGITEWLPVSSTGHMLLFDEFFTLEAAESFKEMFFVVIQLGAILAVVVMFWKKMFPFGMRTKSERSESGKSAVVFKKEIFMMWVKVAVACIPSAVLGILLDDFLEAYFGGAVTISVMLIFYGVAFIIIERWNKKRTPRYETLSDIGFMTAVMIGLFQALSMIPGTSRSGATIIGALIIGVSRTAAAEFTFFLAVPTMLGASAIKILKFGLDFTSAEICALLLGCVTAFTVSLIAIKFLMNFVKRHDFAVFGWYRIVLGALVLLLYFIK